MPKNDDPIVTNEANNPQDTEQKHPSIKKLLSANGVDWVYEFEATQEYREKLMDRYDLHELVGEDLLEHLTQDKIDVYDQCLFVVLHFPKYDLDRERYYTNEFNMILGKDFVVTLSRYKSNHIQRIKREYHESLDEIESDEAYKMSPYYIMYRVIDTMYDKVLRGLRKFSRDLNEIEEQIFDDSTLTKRLLEKIMQKRRNIILLKHMIIPHQEIIDQVQEETTKFYGFELDVYFEDLAYKIDKILGQISIQVEDIESLYDTYNAMVSMKTNTVITVLTIFTVILGVMTFVTGFYGMNVPLPFADNAFTVMYLIAGMCLVALGMVMYFNHKGWMQ